MGTILLTNDLVQVRVWTRDEEQAAVNSLHFRVTATTGTIEDQAVAAYFDTNLAPAYKPLMSQNASYSGVEVQVRRPSPPNVFAPALSGLFAGPGTSGATAQPRQVSGLISFKTLFSGPANRGRNYIPFPATSSLTGEGEPATTYLLDLEALISILEDFVSPGDTIVDAAGTATLVWVIWHRNLAFPSDTTTVQDAVAKTAFATQRRRGSLGKANKSPF